MAATRVAAGYRTCIATDGSWSSFSRVGGGPSRPRPPEPLPPDAGRRTPNVNGIAPVHLVGHLTDVATAAGTVTVDRETWHWCAPEELADEVDQCPNDYKATDPDPGRLTTYRLAPGARILVLEDQTSVDHPATLAALAERLRTEGSVRVVVRLADDGTATGIGEVFTP